MVQKLTYDELITQLFEFTSDDEMGVNINMEFVASLFKNKNIDFYSSSTERMCFGGASEAMIQVMMDIPNPFDCLGCVVCFTSSKYNNLSIVDAMILIRDILHEDALILLGTAVDDSLPDDYVKLTAYYSSDNESINPNPPLSYYYPMSSAYDYM